MIKIGDKVRFLNAVGGGKVVGFQDKNIVLVEEDDGFETPVLVNEVVVVEAGDDMAKAMKKEEKKHTAGTTSQSLHAAMNSGLDDEEDDTPVELSSKAIGNDEEVPYFTADLDSAEGESINLSIAFVPATPQKLQHTDFDLYIINDNNYYASFFISTKDDSSFEGDEEKWTLREKGTVEPHTKLLLNRITDGHVGDWERINIQAIVFKDGRSFTRKPAFDVNIHISPTKFYKESSFSANDYFDGGALVVSAVKNDKQVSPAPVNAETIQEAMQTPKSAQAAPAVPLKSRIEKTESKEDLLEVDLHIDKLLDDTTGMQPKDILDYQVSKFRQTMEAHKKEKGKRIVFIHGKGEGVLRKELWKRLTLEYPSCDKQDASFLRYGFGATMVTIG
ncbi:MAG: DUF2027 domain-containing protein [Paludibacteraceae bacterium]|nr:DUF2027 domain-containing protein [Paludibacteraceae bacterium]